MHSTMASIGLPNGLKEVREALEHPEWGQKFTRGLFDEIVPGIPLDQDELRVYAEETLDRFRNPYIRHRLADIAMNSLSKWKVRVLPSLKAYLERTGELPPLLTESLASLLRLYRPLASKGAACSLLADGSLFTLRDDPKLLELLRTAWDKVAVRGDGIVEAESVAGSIASCVKEILGDPRIWGEDLTLLPGLAEAVSSMLVSWEK